MECTDSFLINLLGNLLCTLKIRNREAVQAIYGTVNYTKVFLYTPGTGTDPTHPNFGFRVEYDPSPGNPNAMPAVPPDANFPAGVTLGGTFDKAPDLTGNLTQPREAMFNGSVVMNPDTYQGGPSSVRATLIFNPGIP